MNDTDQYKCIAPNKYWTLTVKKIDQFLDRQYKGRERMGGTIFPPADKDQMDELIGLLNTLAMVMHDASGTGVNWDQQAVTDSTYNTYNDLGDDNPINQENVSDNTIMSNTAQVAANIL